MSDKRASIKNRSPLDAFLKNEDESSQATNQPVDKSTNQRINKSTSQQVDLRRTGFYVRPDQNKAIDKLLVELQDQEIKANRSAVVRAALDLLLSQDDIGEIGTLVRKQID
jgi:hypothetical protein